MELNLQAFEVRARRAYEWARLRRATLGVTPIALVVCAAALLAARPAPAVGLGALLLVGGIASLWFGHGLQRSLAPGVLAGMLPLVAANCTARVGHVCSGSACYSFCIAAAVLGGAAAGLVLGAWAVRKAAPMTLWASASTAALLTGAMGCSCTGLMGVGALGLGFLAGAPLLAIDRFRRHTGSTR